jgi:AraC-like DNA-binding protein
VRQADEVAFDDEYELFMHVCQYLRQNLSQHLSTRDICSHFHLNEQYLCRMFRKYSDSTILHEMNHARTLEAIRLLRDHHTKISDIAYNLGFDDQYYFTRVFTALTGLSPKKYRDLVFSTQKPFVHDVTTSSVREPNLRGTFYKRHLSRIRPES